MDILVFTIIKVFKRARNLAQHSMIGTTRIYPVQRRQIGVRLRAYYNRLETSARRFAARLGIPAATLSYIVAGRDELRAETFRRAYAHYRLSALWLATGEGAEEDRFLILRDDAFANVEDGCSFATARGAEQLGSIDLSGIGSAIADAVSGFQDKIDDL